MSEPTPNYFTIIPSHISDNEKIDDSTAMLYGRIQSLTNNKGYCFASDEYLAKLTRTSIRTLQRRLRSLRELGYLKICTKKNGMLWDRRIYLNFNYEATPVAVGDDTSVAFETTPVAEEQYKKEQYKKEERESNPSDRLASLLFQKIKSRNPNMKTPKLSTWAKDIDQLIKSSKAREAPYTEEQVESVINWTHNDPFWHVNILSGRSLKEKMDQLVISMNSKKVSKKTIDEEAAAKKVDTYRENKRYAEEMIEKNRSRFTNENYLKMYLGNNKQSVGIQAVITGNLCPTLGFMEHGFKDQLNNLMRRFQ